MSTFGEGLIDDIIGDELNENIRVDGEISDNSDENTQEKDDLPFSKDEAASKQVVEPKKRLVRNPKPRLNIEILSGSRGIHTIENYFKDIKYQGKGHEKQDLNEILKRLKHWAHRMYPAYKFVDILSNIERLSRKKPLQHYMQRYRQGSLNTVENDNSPDENDVGIRNEELDEPFDEFDALINEQIANSKLPPVTPSSTVNRGENTSMISSVVDTPRFLRGYGETSTPCRKNATAVQQIDPAPHECDPTQQKTDNIPEFLRNRIDLTAEQLAKIAENRRLARERLQAKKLTTNNVQ